MNELDPHNIIGIDFGTTNTVAYAYISGVWQAVSYDNTESKCPSVVSIAEKQPLAGFAAKNEMTTNPMCIKNVKRIAGRKLSEPNMDTLIKDCNMKVSESTRNEAVFVCSDGRHYTCADIVAIILRFVLERAKEQSNRPISHCVLTVPAHFNNNQKQTIVRGARIAGLQVLDVVNEPTAAAIGYCDAFNITEGYYLVYDMGGGTLDVSIIEYRQGRFKVLSCEGDNDLGGADFDLIICKHFLEKYKEENGVDYIRGKNEVVKQRRMSKLLEQCEKWKTLLVTMPSVDCDTEAQLSSKSITITRSEVCNWLEPDITRSLYIVRRALQRSGLDIKNINKVLLVGGSSRLFCLKDILGREFKSNELICECLHVDTCVACGASVWGQRIQSGTYINSFMDIVSSNYSLVYENGELDVIFPAGTTLPNRKIRVYDTKTPNEAMFITRIYQGNGRTAHECVEITPICFAIDINARAGRLIQCVFSLSSGGVFSVSCYYQGSTKCIFTTKTQIV